MTSTRNRREHARERARQRYGIGLTKALRRELLQMIRSGQSLKALQLTHTRAAHLLEVRGTQIAVVYSKRVKDIVTVLPRDTWQFKQGASE